MCDFRTAMKIICIGRNYREHAKELNNPIPKVPLIFMKPASALLVNGKPFYYPAFTKDLHYEAEIVLKVCKNGRHVAREFAHSYYDQIALGIDFTARDVQQTLKEKGHPWELAKAFDHSAVISPFIASSNLDPQDINFDLKKNGEVVQEGNTTDLIFDFAYIIEFVSQYFMLQVGDFIFTGTPAGVGPVQIGDVLEGAIEGQELLYCEIK